MVQSMIKILYGYFKLLALYIFARSNSNFEELKFERKQLRPWNDHEGLEGQEGYFNLKIRIKSLSFEKAILNL